MSILRNVVDKSSSQMVQYYNGGLETGLKKPVSGPKCPVFKWSTKSHDFILWILDTPSVRYSDESGIQVSSFRWLLYKFVNG